MDISVVIPLYNEAESLPELEAWIRRVMEEHGFSYEIIFINDGSTDDSWRIIQELREKNPHVRGVKFRRNYGKSPGLQCGFARTQGDVVITMDADLQDSPDEIPGLYHMVKEEGYDLVSGWKQKRYDPVLSKNLPSKLFNATARKLSGIDNLHDFNCGLKAYRSEVVKSIGDLQRMHRYIPYMAKVAGPSHASARRSYSIRRVSMARVSFGLNRFVNGYLDLITLWFTSTFGRKPMHFFGLGGSLMFIIGFLALAVVLCSKLFHIWTGTPAPLVTEPPLPLHRTHGDGHRDAALPLGLCRRAAGTSVAGPQ